MEEAPEWTPCEFCGIYTLMENINIRDFTTLTLPSALSKIVFHTGIISLKLFDVFAKTLCQLMVSQNEPEQFIFTLLFDKSPPQEGSGEELDNNKGEGIFYRFQFNVDEEFFLTIPISGEKIKTLIRRRQKTGHSLVLEQISHFSSGIVEILYHFRGTDLTINYLHKPTSTSAFQLFKKEIEKETEEESVSVSRKSKSSRSGSSSSMNTSKYNKYMANIEAKKQAVQENTK